MDDPGERKSTGLPRRIWQLIRFWAGPLALAALASLLLKLTAADSVSLLKWNYYLPAAFAMAAGLALTALSSAPWPWRTGAAAALVILGLTGLFREQPRLLSSPVPPPPPSEESFTLMTWNVMAYWLGEEQVADLIVETQPDVLALVEGTFAGRRPPYLSGRMGEEYQWAVGQGLSVASKLPIVESSMIEMEYQSLLFRVVLEGPRGKLALHVVDVRPPRPRDDTTTFPELWAAAAAEDLPIILTGDFNLPRGSKWMSPAQKYHFQDAYLEETAPRYLATWPMWPVALPLWQVDHAFSRGLQLTPLPAPFTKASDHQPLVLQVQ